MTDRAIDLGLERQDHVVRAARAQQRKDFLLGRGVEDAVDDPPFLTARQVGFVVELELQVADRLARFVPRGQVVADDAIEREAVRALGQPARPVGPGVAQHGHGMQRAVRQPPRHAPQLALHAGQLGRDLVTHKAKTRRRFAVRCHGVLSSAPR